jgi:hypothetical protein
MRHTQTTLHVTPEAKLSLPIQVELEPADSVVVDGARVYRVGYVSSRTLIPRETGCLLEELRYRFYAGDKPQSNAPLSPWACRDEFLREGVTLQECSAGLSATRVGKGKAAVMVGVRPKGNPTHFWGLGLHGVAGSFTLSNMTEKGDSLLGVGEAALEQECSGWRKLLRDALQMDYADWKQLATKHPARWVNELLTPLPLTVDATGGAPTARVVCQSLLDVLIVTTQLDGIRGLRQRVCHAEGCGELFALGNYEHKLYCDYECAHRQAVRDGRRRKREAIEKAKKSSKKTAIKGRAEK